MLQVHAKEAEKQLVDLLKAALRGEEIFIITDDDQQAIQLVPTPLPERRPRYGSAEGLIEIADDFNAPLEDFEDYMP